MKVKDLIPMEVDIDVYDSVCDDIGIAYCGPMEITEAGRERFGEVLEYPITLRTYGDFPVAIVQIDSPTDEGWEDRLKKAKEFFWSIAGYCADDDFNVWFKYAD